MELADKTVVLTHATNTLGQALARALAGKGARLILSGSDETALTRLAEQLPAHQHRLIASDINTEPGRVSLNQACRQGDGGLDILINNPMSGAQGLFRATSQSAIDTYLSAHLNAPILLTRTLLPQLLKRDTAQIVNIGALTASIGLPGFACDSAARFGVRGFSEALGRELSDSPVKVVYFAHRGIKSTQTRTTNNLSSALKRPLDSADNISKALIQAIKNENPFTQMGWRERLWIRRNTLARKKMDRAIENQRGAFAASARKMSFPER